MKKVIAFIFFSVLQTANAQESLSLESCYDLLQTNYPLIKNRALLSEKSRYKLEAINTKKLPQFNFLIQATYQSDVTQMPIDNAAIGVVPPNKDQYKTEIQLNQLIYANNYVEATKNVEKSESKVALQEVEVSLHQIEKQVNQLYFSIVLQQYKSDLLIQNIELLNTQLSEVVSGIKNGSILPSSDLVIEVQILKLEQELLQSNLNEKRLKLNLSDLIGTNIQQDTKLSTFEIEQFKSAPIASPELALFQYQKEQIDAADILKSKNKTVKIDGFATGGYGNPGLNFLENSFETYYRFGVRLNWNFLDWNANKKERSSLLISKDLIDTQTDLFNLQTKIALEEQQTEIDKFSALISTDKEIIELQNRIVKRAESLLKNGVYLASNYILEVTNLIKAETQLKTNEIQLLLAKANYNSTKGY